MPEKLCSYFLGERNREKGEKNGGKWNMVVYLIFASAFNGHRI